MQPVDNSRSIHRWCNTPHRWYKASNSYVSIHDHARFKRDTWRSFVYLLVVGLGLEVCFGGEGAEQGSSILSLQGVVAILNDLDWARVKT